MVRPLSPFLRAALLIAPFAVGLSVHAQIPTQCLEIERILVDACIDQAACPGATEGQNEMVSFRTGPQVTALTDLVADWPNNSWNGLVQDGTTATLTSILNATITACGLLVEPPGGLIPPGSRVLLVTSTAMCTQANPFTNLTDTLYLIFQAPGNSSGHFANHNNGGTISPVPTGASALRTLVLTYLPMNCSDTATYDRSLLVNTMGTYGGNTADNDGSTAVFSWPGVAQVTYVNFGCQAPFVPNQVTIDDVVGTLCGGNGSVDLTASTSGPFTGALWSGGSGTFDDPASLSPTYTAGPNDLGDVVLSITATFACGDPVTVSVTIPAGNAPVVTITPDGPTTICPGEDVVLTASGADSYVWGNQATSTAITVTQAGTYNVTGTNACGTASAQITITQANGPTVTITPDGPTTICPGEEVVLTASGADTYLWNDQSDTPSITVTQAGTYSVTGTTACGTGTAQITITIANGPAVTITPDGPTVLCPGLSVTLTAEGATSYLWNTQEITASIIVTQPGTYGVTGTNSCGQADAQIVITAGTPPMITITPDGPTTFCAGGSVTLTASGADTYLWNAQQPGASITVTTAGTYVVEGTTACGNDGASIVVEVIDLSASFTADPLVGVAPLDVSFTNTSTAQGTSTSWAFGDGGTSTADSPDHSYLIDGTYNVVLTVSDQGCTSSATAVIIVGTGNTPPSSIFIPNVFSPNGDGVNDQLYLRAENMSVLDLSIYNRYGQEVARLKRGHESWDARTFSGETVPDGTYFYVFEANGLDGVKYKLNGVITVLR
ncbi:MAG: gliding motility-associated C-terminal domain-containing protein [Flavobacteriales bacterium]|nr:gliding motility-associated C-terminal domain-containing protein [Flavobacteriales bacterium]